MSMKHVSVDLSKPWPDLRPGDTITSVHSAGGIVTDLGIDRATDADSARAYKYLREAGVDEATARLAVPSVLLLAHAWNA